jgi:predicted alpha/beta hydrolase family esterase
VSPSHVLILPGWHNSGPEHWQSRWQDLHGYVRVAQHDWLRPRRGDWCMRLEEILLGLDRPAVLVAHGLGCPLVAAWAAHSQQRARVSAALLVTPLDTEREELLGRLPSWQPMALQSLPFKSTLVASSNDPFCQVDRARQFAQAWGSRWHEIGEAGHLDDDKALGDWHQGHALLQALMTH